MANPLQPQTFEVGFYNRIDAVIFVTVEANDQLTARRLAKERLARLTSEDLKRAASDNVPGIRVDGALIDEASIELLAQSGRSSVPSALASTTQGINDRIAAAAAEHRMSRVMASDRPDVAQGQTLVQFGDDSRNYAVFRGPDRDALARQVVQATNLMADVRQRIAARTPFIDVSAEVKAPTAPAEREPDGDYPAPRFE